VAAWAQGSQARRGSPLLEVTIGDTCKAVVDVEVGISPSISPPHSRCLRRGSALQGSGLGSRASSPWIPATRGGHR
jgi:hypothetical protein